MNARTRAWLAIILSLALSIVSLFHGIRLGRIQMGWAYTHSPMSVPKSDQPVYRWFHGFMFSVRGNEFIQEVRTSPGDTLQLWLSIEDELTREQGPGKRSGMTVTWPHARLEMRYAPACRVVLSRH